jgi:hypothetical protein
MTHLLNGDNIQNVIVLNLSSLKNCNFLSVFLQKYETKRADCQVLVNIRRNCSYNFWKYLILIFIT